MPTNKLLKERENQKTTIWQPSEKNHQRVLKGIAESILWNRTFTQSQSIFPQNIY